MQKVKLIQLKCCEGQTTQAIANSFEEANNALKCWANTAPGPGLGYDKVDFTVTWDDGEQYSGRFDLKQEHLQQSFMLQKQIYDALLWFAGQCKYPCCGREKYSRLAEEYKKTGAVKKAIKFLKTYDLD